MSNIDIAADTDLTSQQRARVEALKAARSVLTTTGFASSTGPDAIDLVSLARYIVTGDDPWAGDPA